MNRTLRLSRFSMLPCTYMHIHPSSSGLAMVSVRNTFCPLHELSNSVSYIHDSFVACVVARSLLVACFSPRWCRSVEMALAAGELCTIQSHSCLSVVIIYLDMPPSTYRPQQSSSDMVLEVISTYRTILSSSVLHLRGTSLASYML